MRRRLRKKLRLGEFEDVLIPVAFELSAALSSDEIHAWLDELVEVVEGLDLGFGGVGRYRWSGFVQSAARWGRPTAEQAALLRSWLAMHRAVRRARVGAPMAGSEIDGRLRRDPEFPRVDSAGWEAG